MLTITAAKDAYEDVKRHQSDRRVNHSTVRVLAGGEWVNPNATGKKARTFVRGIIPKGGKPKAVKLADAAAEQGRNKRQSQDNGQGHAGMDSAASFDDMHHDSATHPHWRKTRWEDVRVGDFVKIVNNEALPADILICATSDGDNVAFVETKNLDGETNLKSRNALQALTHIRSAADCADRHNAFALDCDRPDTNMFRLNATLRIDKDAVSADMQMMLLRGTVLRNTDWVIGVVLYTGEDTKIVLNSGGTPSKRSKVERQMNPQV